MSIYFDFTLYSLLLSVTFVQRDNMSINHCFSYRYTVYKKKDSFILYECYFMNTETNIYRLEISPLAYTGFHQGGVFLDEVKKGERG